jgi:hypothetical protein
LRPQRSFAVGLLVEETSDAYASLVIRGFERYLRKNHLFFLT